MKGTIIREFNEHERETMRQHLSMIPTLKSFLGCFGAFIIITAGIFFMFLPKEGKLRNIFIIFLLILTVIFLGLILRRIIPYFTSFFKSVMVGAISIVSLISAAILVYAFLQEGGTLWSWPSITFTWYWTALTIIFGLVIVWLLKIASDALTWRYEIKQKILEAIEHNRVEVLRVHAKEVVAMRDESDHHPHYDTYFFDIGNQQVLCLKLEHWWVLKKGEYVLFVSDRSILPNNCFEIVRTVNHRLWVGVFCYGEVLKPSRDLSFDSYDSNYQPSDEASTLLKVSPSSPVTIFKGSLDDLEETLKKDPIEVWE